MNVYCMYILDRLKERAVTVDGNEQLLQVNYLSPVLLSLLMARDIVAPALALTTAADAKTTPVALPHDLRIVNLSTGFHAKGKLNFDDRLQTTEGYENMKVTNEAMRLVGEKVLLTVSPFTSITPFHFN